MRSFFSLSLSCFFVVVSFSLAFLRTDYTFLFYCLTRYGFVCCGCCCFYFSPCRHIDEMILTLCNFISNWQLVCRFFKQLNFLDLYFCPCLFPSSSFSGFFVVFIFCLSKQNTHVHANTLKKWAKGPLDIAF